MKPGFVFYRSFSEAMEGLPAEEYKAIMVALCHYALDGEDPINLNPVCNTIFTLIKPQIDANSRKYENGCKGGRPKKETEQKPSQNQTETKTKPNDNQSKTKQEPKEKDKDKDKVKEKEINKEKENDPVLDEAIKNFERHRKQMKAPLTDRALELAINKLEQLAPGDTATKVRIIDQSIAMGWKGLFPLKESPPGTFRPDDLDSQIITGIQNRRIEPAPDTADWSTYFEA